MKRGGVGYAQPGPDTFPNIDEVNRLIVACGALPCAAWLDGTTSGEQAIEELLELLISKGAAALNIIPDRNWNISDPEMRRIKVKKLYEVVELAQKLDLPLNVGTEMNSYGQRLVDDFECARDGTSSRIVFGWRLFHLWSYDYAACSGAGLSKRMGEDSPPHAP